MSEWVGEWVSGCREGVGEGGSEWVSGWVGGSGCREGEVEREGGTCMENEREGIGNYRMLFFWVLFAVRELHSQSSLLFSLLSKSINYEHTFGHIGQHDTISTAVRRRCLSISGIASQRFDAVWYAQAALENTPPTFPPTRYTH